MSKEFKEIMLDTKSIESSECWKYYLVGRGISVETGMKFGRIDVRKNRLAIPIENCEEIVGIKYRSMEKNMSCETGSSMSFLMNWQNVKSEDVLIITEGEMDMMSVGEVGFENVVSLPNGVANLVCLDMQNRWLSKFTKIIIATDNDDAGKKCKNEIVKKLGYVKDKFFEPDYMGEKDFNDVLKKLGKEKLREMINGAVPFVYEAEEDLEFKELNGYYYKLTQGSYEQITNFVLKIEKLSHNFFEGTSINLAYSQKFKSIKTELLCKQGLLKHFGYFIGNDKDIPKFLYWLEERNKNKFAKEILHYGIVDEEYFDTESNVICPRNDMEFKTQKEIEPATLEEVAWLDKNLINIRKDKMQSLTALSWAVGKFHESKQYPILEVCGTTTIGKTDFTLMISKIMFGVEKNIKPINLLSDHQVRSLASSSNITPFCIDEIKFVANRKNNPVKIVDLSSVLRAVYDTKTATQGNITDRLTEFKLCSPIIISGESELSDVSLKNRVVPIKLTQENKSDDEIFDVIKDTDILYKFGKLILENRLANKIIISKSEAKNILKTVTDDRQIHNAKCLLQGFQAIKEIINIEPADEKNFYLHLQRIFSNEYTIEKNFVALLDLVRESGEYFGNFYVDDTRGHYANFSPLYKAIADEHLKTNSLLELMDMASLKRQLKECKFIIGRGTKYFGSLGQNHLFHACIFKQNLENNEN